MKLKTVLLSALMVSILAIGTTWAETQTTPAAATKEQIKIGDSFAYASFARFGGPYKKGWQLAVEEINRNGGVCITDNDCRPFQVISIDHTDNPANAQRIVSGLVERDHVKALTGTVLTNVTNAIGSYAGQAKIPLITTWSSVLAKDGPQNDYMFSMMPVEPHSLASAEFAATLPIKKWALIGPDIAWGRTGNELFKQHLKKLRPDVEFVTEQWPPLMKFNATSEFAALRQAQPEGIFSTLFGTDFFSFVREGKRLGFFDGKTVIATEAGQKAHLDVIGKEMKQGTWYGTGYSPQNISSPAHKNFYESYKLKYGEEPELYSLAAYNIYIMLAKAIEKAGSTDADAISKALVGLETETPMGKVKIFSNHRANFGVWLGQITNGKLVDAHYYDAARYIGD